MLKGKESPRDSSSSDKAHVSPPPVPPKPKTNLTTSANNLYNSSNAWRYFPCKSDTYSPIEAANKINNNNTSQLYDAHYQSIQADNNDQNYYLKSSSSTAKTTTIATTEPIPKSRPTTIKAFTTSTKITSMYSNQPTDIYISNDNIYDQNEDDDYDNNHEINDNYSHLADSRCQFNSSSCGSQSNAKPIVTESPEEANNNNNKYNNLKQKKAINTSTVEILEVPLKRYSSKITTLIDAASAPALSQQQPPPLQNKQLNNTHHDNSNYPLKLSRSQLHNQPHQHVANVELFYENNNSYAAPVVTTTTDDEGDDDDEMLPTEVEVETILNESSSKHYQTPRTSTPSKNSNIKYAPIEDNINNHIPKSRNSGTSNCSGSNNTSREDTVNISIETDEIPDNPLNQSGGGEVVGIFETSDHTNNSKASPSFQNTVPSNYQDKMAFSEFIDSQTEAGKQKRLLGQHSPCQEKLKEFENLTQIMVNEIDKLKTQITGLKTKVNELEVQVNKQQQVTTRDNEGIAANDQSVLNIFTKQTYTDRYSPSQSTSTANSRLISSNIQTQPTSANRFPTSTYSRSNVATISRSSSAYPSPSSYTSKPATIHSSSNTVTKPLRKNNIQHTSTNSLYAESLKSCSASISPTSNYNQRRDPLTYTSLLSLSSIGGSTLKKAHPAATAGSVSNLSQAGKTALSQWPSLSDFLPAKHRGKEIVYNENERTIDMVLYSRLITMQLPKWVENNYSLDKIVEPPSVRLRLDWVHGYRGRDCRSNIFYLPTGECIYFVASIVVLYNSDEKTQRHYLGHTDSVKCLAVHPNKLIVASGQSAILNRRDKRPIVRIWNTVNLSTIRVISFNEDFDRSICCLAFSKQDQGATLAVVDESNDHTITLLDWQREKNWRIAETNSGHEPVLAIDFHPIEKYSLVAVGKSTINFWDTRGMTLTKRAGLFDKLDKPKYVLCLTFNDLGETVTGDSNGSIIIWPKGSNRPKTIIRDAHQGGVFSVLAMKDGTYLSGGRDRRIVEWDENFEPTGNEAELPEQCGGVRYITYARGNLVLVGTLRNSILLGSLKTNFTLIMRGHSEAVTSLAVHPELNHYVTGGFDDQIHLFDSKTHEIVWSKSLMMPITAANFSPNGNLLVVGSTIGKWLVLDAVSQEILFTKCDGSGSINCIKFSPDGEYFCLGSSDCHVYIYQTTDSSTKFSRVGACVGHSASIKEIDWSEDSRFIQTQSMNFELLFWKALNCRPADESDNIDDLSWSTQNCTIGFNVIGLWSDSIDSALINHCDKSNNGDLIVSVTDTGSINVFKCPPCYDQCLSQKYYGNVEKFHFIKFLPDDSKLIAVGAKSCVTTEWVVDKGAL